MNYYPLFAIVAILIVVAAVWLSLKSNILKDISRQTQDDRKPYSFSRTQLMWWTVLISCSYVLAFGTTMKFPDLDPSILILLGLSSGTTVLGRIIDNTQMMEGRARHQDIPYVGFWTDIISDENGVSVHRFQALVFNVLFGVIYMVLFFSEKHGLPEFSPEQLGLMGISSTAYVGLKMNENSAKKPALTQDFQSEKLS